MFNIGSGELALIAVAALLILGPKRLPELARGIGKFMREFRRQTDEVRGVVEREFYKMDQDLPHAAAPKLSPAPGLVPVGDELHNPDGTLKEGVSPELAAALGGGDAPGEAAAPAQPGGPAPDVPAAAGDAPAPAAPASPAASPDPDALPPATDDVKSQVTKGMPASEPTPVTPGGPPWGEKS